MTSDEGDDIKGSPMISNIQFGNKNKCYTGLVDSGSDVSLLNWNVLQSIPRKNIHFWKKKITPLVADIDDTEVIWIALLRHAGKNTGST